MTDPRTPEQWTPRPPLAAAPGDFVPGTLLGDWQVEAKIGEGGMGTVYAVVHAVIGKRAALKVIRSELCADPTGGERFVQEARLVNQIGHPNIVDIFHIGRLDDGRPYLVMELLLGRTLGERISEGRVPTVEALELLLQICAALGAAHARGVVHRDLKPDNIFVVETRSGPVVKLVDWGIAKLSDANARGTAMTRTGALVGTPQYISPEQARGRDVDERTDLYSLGAIAYEVLLEEPPFTADNVADLIAAHLREAVPPPAEVWPDIPVPLEQLLVSMLAKSPAERPTLAQIIDALAAVRVELEMRNESRRHVRRMADGSLPPTMSTHAPTLPSHTTGSGIPVAFTALGSASVEILGSGPVTASASMPASAPAPVRRRGRWIAAAVLVLAGAALAWGFVLDRRDRSDDAAPPVAEPAAPASAPAPAAFAAGAPVVVTVPVPTAAPSAIDLAVTPRNARVVLDGERIALDAGRLAREVAAGSHRLEITAPGHVTYQRTLDVGAGTLRLEVVLEAERRRSSRKGADRRTPAAAPPTNPSDPDGTIDPFE